MGSIDALEKIQLGGWDQWISLRSKNDSMPILLFLHGGPGTAQIFFSRKTQKDLEDHFIVVNWDQRGAGKSYNAKMDRTDLGIGNFLDDTENLIEYLLLRFHQKKLFLVGHSWGSYLGIKVAAKRPELLYAYIGIGQIVDMKKGELISYKFALGEAKRQNDQKAIESLQKIGEPPYDDLKKSGIQRKWLDKYHGTTNKGSVLGYIARNISLGDVTPLYLLRFIKGVVLSLQCLEREVNNLNVSDEIKEVGTNVYFFEGRHDYTVPSILAEEYLKKLSAPRKEIIWFEKSSHLPNFEEPALFVESCARLKRPLICHKTYLERSSDCHYNASSLPLSDVLLKGKIMEKKGRPRSGWNQPFCVRPCFI